MANDYWLDRAMRRMREGVSRPGGPMPDEAELIAVFDAWQRDKATFTQGDVKLLLDIACGLDLSAEEEEALKSIADRIAALLPPNDH